MSMEWVKVGLGLGKVKGSRWGSMVAEKAHGEVRVDGRGTPADTWGFSQHWAWDNAME